MINKIVTIPNIAEEVRIGYSFNYLIKVIAETELAETVQWDFKNVHFLHPFFLAPLAIYKNTSGVEVHLLAILSVNCLTIFTSILIVRTVMSSLNIWKKKAILIFV